jgi:hypothetical protein
MELAFDLLFVWLKFLIISYGKKKMIILLNNRERQSVLM